jgi:hypothetical protein
MSVEPKKSHCKLSKIVAGRANGKSTSATKYFDGLHPGRRRLRFRGLPRFAHRSSLVSDGRTQPIFEIDCKIELFKLIQYELALAAGWQSVVSFDYTADIVVAF